MGTTETLERGIWLTRVALDDYEVRGALILGTRRAVVWDTLARPANMRPFLPFIGGRELVVVYSHADWDHIWGTAGLPRPERIVAHAACRQRFDDDVPGVLADKQRAEPGRWDDVLLLPPTETFENEWSLDLGGMTLTLHHLPGHTPDCIVGSIADRGIFLAGDTAETPCPVVPSDSPLEEWIGGLRRWSGDERVRRVVPAHGPVGGREILESNVAYLEGIRDGSATAPAGPLTGFYRETHERNLRWGQQGT